MLDDNDTTTPDTSAAPADSGETAGSAEPGPAAPVAKKVTRKRAVKKTGPPRRPPRPPPTSSSRCPTAPAPRRSGRGEHR